MLLIECIKDKGAYNKRTVLGRLKFLSPFYWTLQLNISVCGGRELSVLGFAFTRGIYNEDLKLRTIRD